MSRRDGLLDLVAAAVQEQRSITTLLTAAKVSARRSHGNRAGDRNRRNSVIANLILDMSGFTLVAQAAIRMVLQSDHSTADAGACPGNEMWVRGLVAAVGFCRTVDAVRRHGPNHIWFFKAARMVAEAYVYQKIREHTVKGCGVQADQILAWLRQGWPEAGRGARHRVFFEKLMESENFRKVVLRRLRRVWKISYGKMGRSAYIEPDIMRRRVLRSVHKRFRCQTPRSNSQPYNVTHKGDHFLAPYVGTSVVLLY
jgi:hypothetical protein